MALFVPQLGKEKMRLLLSQRQTETKSFMIYQNLLDLLYII